MVISLILIIAGTLLLLNNLDIATNLTRNWPLILIAGGIFGLIEKISRKRTLLSRNCIILILTGTIFFLYYNFDINFKKSWPLILIAIGLSGVIKKIVWKLMPELHSRV